MGAFLHAVRVFFDHLAAVHWMPLAIAVALHLLKIVFRAIAWRTILRASYPTERLKFRVVLGAYVAGVGVNSVAPARSGDLVKLYLVKHRLKESSYATLAPTLVVETLFDFLVAGALMAWALSIGVLPTHEVYSRRPTVDWKWFVLHERFTIVLVAVLLAAGLVGFVWARRRFSAFRVRVRQGFAILRDRPRFLRGVILPQAISWVLRIASLFFFLRAFGVRATVHNALLSQVVESLATLFPATPGGAGTKQGLIVYLFHGQAISRTLLLAFSVGMNIVLVVVNLLIGLTALGVMAKTLSWRRLRSAQAAEEKVVAQEP